MPVCVHYMCEYRGVRVERTQGEMSGDCACGCLRVKSWLVCFVFVCVWARTAEK